MFYIYIYRITDFEMRFIRTLKYTWMDCNRNVGIDKQKSEALRYNMQTECKETYIPDY